MVNNNKETLNNNEYTKIGSFLFYTDKNLENCDEYFESFPKEEIIQYAKLDDNLKDANMFYMFMEDYIYNIIVPARKGYDLFIKQDKELAKFANVYSTNYKKSEKQKVLRK